MPKKTMKAVEETHPGLARWVEAYGTVEFGCCRKTQPAIHVLDEGGLEDGVSQSQPSPFP